MEKKTDEAVQLQLANLMTPIFPSPTTQDPRSARSLVPTASACLLPQTLLRLLMQNSAFTDHLEASRPSEGHLRIASKLIYISGDFKMIVCMHQHNKPCPASNRSAKCLQMPSTCIFITTSTSTWSAERSSSQ